MKPVSNAPPPSDWFKSEIDACKQLSEQRRSAFESEINAFKQLTSQMAADMSRVSQQQARQQPLAATHRGTSEKQNVHILQQTDQPRAQHSGHRADSHQHHPAPMTGWSPMETVSQFKARQPLEQMRLEQMRNAGPAGIEQRLRRLEDDRRAELNKIFGVIWRRLDQLERERGERQAVMKRCLDAFRRLEEISNLEWDLEERQAGAEERINNLEGEMVDFRNNLQTLTQTQSDVISNSNKDIHKGIHMEGKGEIHTPSLGRVTQGVGESDPAPPRVVSNLACHSLGAPEKKLNAFQGREEQPEVTPHQGEGEARASTPINNHSFPGPGEEQENPSTTLNEDMSYFQALMRWGRKLYTGDTRSRTSPPLVDGEKCAPTSANHDYIQERRPLLFQDDPTKGAHGEKPPEMEADYAPVKTPQGPSAAIPPPGAGRPAPQAPHLMLLFKE